MEPLEITDSSTLKVYFDSSIDSLSSFFNSQIDTNCQFIKSVDFSNFATVVPDMSYLFNGCTSLESVNFNNFKGTTVTNMKFIFSNCNIIKSIDLSSFTFENIVEDGIFGMISNCSSLISIDLSGFNNQNLDLSNIFENNEGSLDLIYTNLYNSKLSLDKFINFTKKRLDHAMSKTLFICMEEDAFSKCNGDFCENLKTLVKICCVDNNNKCETSIGDNYITVNYNNEVSYGRSKFLNYYNSRINLVRIFLDGIQKEIGEPLEITDSSTLKIYFEFPFESLYGFFSADYDPNVINIKSIDFSHFDLSNTKDMSNLFKGCTSLESFNFGEFDASKVTDMSYMFFNCTMFESIDLSSFKRKEETLATGMFAFCDSLMFIDLSNLYLKDKLESLIKADTAQENFKIKYINLYSSSINESDIYNFANYSLQLNSKEEIFYCFNDDVSLNLADYIYQRENPKLYKDHIKKCCNFDYVNYKCNETNYVMVNFNSKFKYENGFYNSHRTNIDKIVLDYAQKGLDEALNIIELSDLKIYFKESINSLQSFFEKKEDDNVKYINTIDFSKLDTSKVTDMSYLLYGCTSLESVSLENINTSLVITFDSMFRDCFSLKSIDLSYFDTSSAEKMGKMFYRCQSLEYIDLSYFDTSSVTSMEEMFYNCTSLEYLDLSYFDTSLVNNMNSMFSQCTKLKVLDISSFNMEKISMAKNMFANLFELQYINIYNVQNTEDYIKESYLKTIEYLTICQSENIIISEKNASYNCCYYDIPTNKCESYSYMLIYYDQDVTYKNGFSYTDTNYDEFRKGDYFIINKNYTNKISNDNELVISKGSKLEIHFKSDITSLENYFNTYHDPNALYVQKVDLSHLDTSSVTTTSNMFYNCSNLQSVYISNEEITSLEDMYMMFYNCKSLKDVELLYFNTSLVKNMESMFDGCEKLEILELSNFDTSSVNNMAKMFNGCKNLKYLDISTFNFERVTEIEKIFNGTNKLNYLNLYNTNNSFILKNQELDIWDNPTVCQKEKVITQDDVIEECCYFNINSNKCESSNFIVLYFGKETIYEKGFIKDNQGNIIRGEEIDFIINGNHSIKYKSSDKLNIGKGKKIEIYFKSGIKSLDNYFSIIKDPNMENVVSMDLSHFNTSLVNNMSSMFYGCHSLMDVIH